MKTQQRLVYSLAELRALHAGFQHLLAHGPESKDWGICYALAQQVGVDPATGDRTFLYQSAAYDFMAMALDLWPWALREEQGALPTVHDNARPYPVPGEGAAWSADSSAGAFRWDALAFCAGVCELMLMSRGKPMLQMIHDDLMALGEVPALADQPAPM